MNKRIITLFIVGLIFGFMVGYAVGTAVTINWVVSKALSFMEIEGIEIGLNQSQITAIITRYQSYIDFMYP